MIDNVMETEIKAIVSHYLRLPIDALPPHANFSEDLGADSLANIEIIMALEKKFDVEIPDEDARTINCINAALEFIKKRTCMTA